MKKILLVLSAMAIFTLSVFSSCEPSKRMQDPSNGSMTDSTANPGGNMRTDTTQRN